jgi:hypothetical protein
VSVNYVPEIHVSDVCELVGDGNMKLVFLDILFCNDLSSDTYSLKSPVSHDISSMHILMPLFFLVMHCTVVRS